jgi:hypothetical protein
MKTKNQPNIERAMKARIKLAKLNATVSERNNLSAYLCTNTTIIKTIQGLTNEQVYKICVPPEPATSAATKPPAPSALVAAPSTPSPKAQDAPSAATPSVAKPVVTAVVPGPTAPVAPSRPAVPLPPSGGTPAPTTATLATKVADLTSIPTATSEVVK